jgi:hypothetical protein
VNPIDEARKIISNHDVTLYSVPYCVWVIEQLVNKVETQEQQLQLFREAQRVDPL